MIRERLDDPITRREALECEYLRRLMQRDARIWKRRTGYELGGVIDGPPDEPDEKQDPVNRNGQHSAPLDSPTAWTGCLGTRGWID